MVSKYLDTGIYTNIFPVQIPDATVEVMTAKASDYPDLKGLREEIHASSCEFTAWKISSSVTVLIWIGWLIYVLKDGGFVCMTIQNGVLG